MSDLLREVGPAHDLLTVRRGKDRPLRGRELPLRNDRDVRELTHLVAVRLDDPAVLYLRQVRHRAKAYSAAIRRGRGRAQGRGPGARSDTRSGTRSDDLRPLQFVHPRAPSRAYPHALEEDPCHRQAKPAFARALSPTRPSWPPSRRTGRAPRS